MGCGGEQGSKAGRSSCGPCRGRGNRLRPRSPPSPVTSQQAHSFRRCGESLGQGSMTLLVLQGHSLSEVTVLNTSLPFVTEETASYKIRGGLHGEEPRGLVRRLRGGVYLMPDPCSSFLARLV